MSPESIELADLAHSITIDFEAEIGADGALWPTEVLRRGQIDIDANTKLLESNRHRLEENKKLFLRMVDHVEKPQDTA